MQREAREHFRQKYYGRHIQYYSNMVAWHNLDPNLAHELITVTTTSHIKQKVTPPPPPPPPKKMYTLNFKFT
jgi:hypothetical protein